VVRLVLRTPSDLMPCEKHPDANNVKILFGLTLASLANESLKVNDVSLMDLHQHIGINTPTHDTLVKARLLLCLIMVFFVSLKKGEYLQSNRCKKDRQGAPIRYHLTRNMLTFYTDTDYSV
jgi:hypothetical protein